MTNDTMVTIHGWIGSDPAHRLVAGTPVINFRVGSTPRRFVKSTGEWVDGQTQWYSVSAWRSLADNADRALEKGDPVIIHGRLSHRTYVNRLGVEVLSLEIEALSIGHDLNRGWTKFRRVVRTAEPPIRPEAEEPQFGPLPEDPFVMPREANGPAPEGEDDDSRTAA